MIGRVAATLFIVAFFSALPAWFLSGRDGWVTFECAGTPWTCVVSKWNLLSRSSATYTPREISRGEELISYRRRRSYEFTVQLDGVAVTESRPSRDEVDAIVAQLEAARAARKAFQLELQPTWFFWFSVALVVLFAGCGLMLGVLGGRDVKARPRR